MPDIEPYNVQGGEWVNIARCPLCHSKLYDEDRPCPLCDERMSEKDVVCPSCKKEVARVMNIALNDIGFHSDRLTALDVINDLWDDITEWARIEDRKDEDREKAMQKETNDFFDGKLSLYGTRRKQ